MVSTEDTTATKPTITIVDAEERDAAAISKVGSRTFVESFGFALQDHELDAFLFQNYSASVIGSEIADPSRHKFLVAKIDGLIVGFLQLRFDTTEPCLPADTHSLEIGRVYVDSTQLSSGIGAALMKQGLRYFEDVFVKDARAQGKERIGVWLGVWEHNEKAQRFYKRFGFEKIGEHGFPIGQRVDIDWVMFKWAGTEGHKKT